MKTLFNIIKFLIIIAILGAVVILGTNKTFIYDHYSTEDMYEKGIPIKRFMYFLEDNNNTVKFITPISITALNEEKDNYLNTLKNCYGKYYHDENNNITIMDYKITEDNRFNNVTIKYDYKNYCSEDYVLSDMWVYEYNSLSAFVSGSITEKAMIKLIGDIYDTKRVEDPKITDYKSQVKIKVNCHARKYDYELVFEDFSENELKVTKLYEDHEQFAVYTMENVVEYLNSLEKA